MHTNKRKYILSCPEHSLIDVQSNSNWKHNKNCLEIVQSRFYSVLASVVGLAELSALLLNPEKLMILKTYSFSRFVGFANWENQKRINVLGFGGQTELSALLVSPKKPQNLTTYTFFRFLGFANSGNRKTHMSVLGLYGCLGPDRTIWAVGSV